MRREEVPHIACAAVLQPTLQPLPGEEKSLFSDVSNQWGKRGTPKHKFPRRVGVAGTGIGGIRSESARLGSAELGLAPDRSATQLGQISARLPGWSAPRLAARQPGCSSAHVGTQIFFALLRLFLPSPLGPRRLAAELPLLPCYLTTLPASLHYPVAATLPGSVALLSAPLHLPLQRRLECPESPRICCVQLAPNLGALYLASTLRAWP